MKKLNLLILLLVSISLLAQNSEKKWQLNAGAHALNYRYPIDIPENMFKSEETNFSWPLSNLMISRHLFSGLSLEMDLAAAKIAKNPSSQIANTLFGNGFMNLKYSFANNYILKNSSFIEPYLKGGIGLTYLNRAGNKFFTTYDYGGGLAFWFTKDRNFGLQLQEMYGRIPQFQYNVEDYFNHSVSLAYRFGMKDSDKDGIADKNDECPNEAGKKEHNGCPDRDNDGVVDKKDECPDSAGLVSLNGCPDSDSDGIANHVDKCPLEKGPKATLGCPDKDGDGIEDKADECPDAPGILLYNGCPDTDGDSLPDNKDECPEEKGLIELQGCPDNDSDQIANHLDKCPDLYGPKENNGCPEDAVKKERARVNEEIAFHAKSIFFNTGKSTLKKESYSVLNNIIKIMGSAPNEVFYIEGHTDNVGNEGLNLKLSRARAKAVKSYFTKKGIDASRLLDEGYGIKYPIADNNTDEGRTQNRRVDISIKQ